MKPADTRYWRNTLLSRFAPRAGLVTSCQNLFVGAISPSLEDCHAVPNSRWQWGVALRSRQLALDLVEAAQDREGLSSEVMAEEEAILRLGGESGWGLSCKRINSALLALRVGEALGGAHLRFHTSYGRSVVA